MEASTVFICDDSKTVHEIVKICPKLTYMEICINTASSEVWICENRVNFSLKEKAVLELMLENSEVILGRNQIMHAVWGDHYYGDVRAVDAFVRRIRKKLPREGISFEITTVYGMGYRLQQKA